MAEKGFGVKEVNLIGASGTPTIASPNNLNLNANNVAISTNVSIGGTLSVTGNVSIGGTLTYEDVTNIDSVGVITARDSIKVGTGATIKSNGDLFVGGQTILTGIVTTKNSVLIEGGSANVDIGNLNQGFYLLNGNSTHLSLYWSSSASSNYLSGTGSHGLVINDFSGISITPSSGACSLGYGGSGKLVTTNTGITVTGDVGAGTFTGSGASLTTLNASQLTSGTIPDARFPSTLPAVSGANLTNIAAPVESPVANFTITSSGSSAYRISGGGLDPTANNPDIYLIRGQKYRFNNTTGSAHPFQFRLTSSGSAYTDGITGNQNGVQFFTPDNTTPSKLFYICTLHSAMVGNIYISGASSSGSSGQVLTSQGSGSAAQYATPAVLQYKYRGNNTQISRSSTGYGDMGFGGVEITPKFSSSIMIVTFTTRGYANGSNQSYFSFYFNTSGGSYSQVPGLDNNNGMARIINGDDFTLSMRYAHDHNTTNTLQYKVYGNIGGGTTYLNWDSSYGLLTVEEIPS